MIDWGNTKSEQKSEAEQPVSEAEDNETTTDNQKQHARIHKQIIKAQCLELAHNTDHTSEGVVKRAKAYYEFVTGTKLRGK